MLVFLLKAEPAVFSMLVVCRNMVLIHLEVFECVYVLRIWWFGAVTDNSWRSLSISPQPNGLLLELCAQCSGTWLLGRRW